MTTFPEVLARLLAGDAARPLITYYDERTGERTELSATTWATWVAKMSALLADELELEPGDRLLVELPAHWIGTVVLGAAWSCGLEIVWEQPVDGRVAAVVTGPDGLTRHAAHAALIPVVATALRPLAGPFPEGVPPGVHDLGVEVWSQPDVYAAYPGPSGSDLAVAGVTQDALWESAAAGDHVSGGGRLLTEANPASASGLAALTEPLSSGGSLVVVVGASPERLERIASDERVTHRFRRGPASGTRFGRLTRRRSDSAADRLASPGSYPVTRCRTNRSGAPSGSVSGISWAPCRARLAGSAEGRSACAAYADMPALSPACDPPV